MDPLVSFFVGIWIVNHSFYFLLFKLYLIYFQLLWINLYGIIIDHCSQAIIERSIFA